MAKKRRRDSEDDEEFKLPEFDEGEFLRKELLGAKVMLLSVLLAVAGGIISYFLTKAGVVIIAFFAGLALIFLLKYVLQAIGFDTSKFERKDWMGQGTAYFFAWLTVWVLLLNVPFSDVTPPNITVFIHGSSFTDPGCNPDTQQNVCQVNVNTSSVEVTTHAADNAGVASVLISIDHAAPIKMTQNGTTLWTYTLSGMTPIGAVKIVTVQANDINGNWSSRVEVTIVRVPP